MEIYKLKIKKTISLLRCDPVLLAAVIAAVISAIFVPPSKKYIGYLDLRVISLLLSLMLVVAGLKKAGAFKFLIEHMLKLVNNIRSLAAVLIGLCFFGSMLITNDVALITFVPLGIMLLNHTNKQKLLIPIITLQTVAANLGSMLTPLGNPQNLYLYSISNMTALQFMKVMAVPSAISFIMFAISVCLFKPEKIEYAGESSRQTLVKAEIIPWIVLFMICMLAVLHIISYGIVLVAVIAAALVIDYKILFSADYGLLFTFAFLFIFIGNIKSIPAVSTALSVLVKGRELPAGIILSQIISNVPAALLLSKFTANYRSLLIGVNLGGLGTLIASMASLISYKQYAATAGAKKGAYFLAFTVVNLLFLGVLLAATSIFIAI